MPAAISVIRKTCDTLIRLISILDSITIERIRKAFAYITITAQTENYRKANVDNNEIHLKRPARENEENKSRKQTAEFCE